MSKRLVDVAHVKAGHPFRGQIPQNDAGDVFAVQIKDIDNDGTLHWPQLIRTNTVRQKSMDWLQQGDVIFAARGTRNIAAFVDDTVNKQPLPTVCGPHYFIIQVTDKRVLPAFIAWQLNQQPAQRYFKASAEGSLQVSIRRAVLEATALVIPSLAEQQAIIGLDNTVKQEKQRLNALIDNRAKQMQGIAQRVLSNKNS